jgi:GATA-binding protein
MSHSPGSSYRDFEHQDGSGVKMEDHSPVIISSQSGYCQSQQSSQMPLAGYMSPHGIPIQHTDDAASKETQYLRRRCFNCHTTEPPSWRRSTLTPGKIVCNKCGLYERTHLRPRPLRFDELRAGNKSRKQTKSSPKGGKVTPPGSLSIKKEPADMEAISRRMSVSSNSSVQSGGGGSSDWDESISVYSSGSAPASGYSSPAIASFSMPRDQNSQSPPMDSSGIRLPNAPLSDIASLQGSRKPTSSPYFHNNSLPVPSQGDMFVRRQGEQGNAALRRPIDIPEVTGWQTVPLTELGPPGRVVRKNSTPVRKAVTA